MNRNVLVDMVKHNLEHTRAGTIDKAAAVMQVPATSYTDPARWSQECDKLFRRTPIVFGLSSELPEIGDYRAAEIFGQPVLVVRQDDGTVQAFVNMCTHRGAKLVHDGTGNAKLFSCTYHAWTFSRTGDLRSPASPSDFGKVDKSCLGLTQLPAIERAGLIWVVLKPGEAVDFDAYLGGYDAMLEAFNFKDWTVFGRTTLTSSNWKLAYDGYLDFYHLPVLHKNSFQAKFANRALIYSWGPHQRAITPDPSLEKLDEKAEADWDVKHMLKGVWTIFPNAALVSMDGRNTAMMLSQIFPGDDVDHCYSVHTLLTEESDPSEEQTKLRQEQFDFFVQVLRDEDYTTCVDIQKNLKTGARDYVMFGQNEIGGQNYHRWVDAVVATETAEDRNELYRRSHNWVEGVRHAAQ